MTTKIQEIIKNLEIHQQKNDEKSNIILEKIELLSE